MVGTVWSKKRLSSFGQERHKASNSEHIQVRIFFFLQTEATSEILPAVKSHKFIAPWWLKETHCFSACIVQISVMLCYIFVCFFLLSYTIAQTRNLLFSSFHFPFKKRKERKKRQLVFVCDLTDISLNTNTGRNASLNNMNLKRKKKKSC